MPRREIKAYVTADTKDLKKGLSDAEKAFKGLEGVLGRLGPVGRVAQAVLDKLGISSVITAHSIAGVLIGAVTALTGALIAGAEHYVKIADEVENFRRVSGASAKDSSDLVAAFKALGVGADTAALAIFKLSRTAAGGQGSLVERLYSVADAYVAAGDGAARDKIVFDAFGKSGAAMIPILEQGSKGLRDVTSATHQVFTEADLERVKKMEIKIRDQKNAWDALWATIGGKVVGGFASLADQIEATNDAQRRINEEIAAGGPAARMDTRALQELEAKYVAQALAALDAAQGSEAHAATMQDEAKFAKELADDLNKTIDAEEKLANESLDAARANLNVQQSAFKVAEALQAYRDAVKEHGQKSVEAQKALLNYKGVLLDQKDAYLAAGKAARQLVLDQEAGGDAQKAARDATQAEIDTLQGMANKLAPNSPLRKYLQQYINELRNEIPKSVTTVLNLTGGRAGNKGTGGGVQMAEGGIVKATPGGTNVTLGEGGHDEAVVPLNGSGKVMGGNNFHIHVDRGAFIDGPSIDILISRLIDRMRTTGAL